MTLPKKARSLEVDGVLYRWMVGKKVAQHVQVRVETPQKEIHSFRIRVEKYDYSSDETQSFSVTPAMVRDFIRESVQTWP